MTNAEFREEALRMIELDELVTATSKQIDRLRETIRPALECLAPGEFVRVGSYVFWINDCEEVCFVRLKSWFEIPEVIICKECCEECEEDE